MKRDLRVRSRGCAFTLRYVKVAFLRCLCLMYFGCVSLTPRASAASASRLLEMRCAGGEVTCSIGSDLGRSRADLGRISSLGVISA